MINAKLGYMNVPEKSVIDSVITATVAFFKLIHDQYAKFERSAKDMMLSFVMENTKLAVRTRTKGAGKKATNLIQELLMG